MTSLRPLALLALALPLSAWGQSAPPSTPSVPDEEWSGYAGPHTPPPPLPPEEESVGSDRPRLRAPAAPPLEEAEEPEQEVEFHAPPPEPPNDVSLFGAPSLGKGRGGAGAALGFPYLSARVL